MKFRDASYSQPCFFSTFRAAVEENAYNRMKKVVKWYISGFYKKPKVWIPSKNIPPTPPADDIRMRIFACEPTGLEEAL